MSTPTRVCFELRVKPELLEEYIERHTPVWPEMLAEIAAAGRRNYSLFLADGGRLIGYYETDDDAAAQALTRAGGSGNTGCLGLAHFYEGVAKDRRPWAEWLSRHPFPDRHRGGGVRRGATTGTLRPRAAHVHSAHRP